MLRHEVAVATYFSQCSVPFCRRHWQTFCIHEGIINMESYSFWLLYIKYTELKRREDEHYCHKLAKVSGDEMDGELDTVLCNHWFRARAKILLYFKISNLIPNQITIFKKKWTQNKVISDLTINGNCLFLVENFPKLFLIEGGGCPWAVGLNNFCLPSSNPSNFSFANLKLVQANPLCMN